MSSVELAEQKNMSPMLESFLKKPCDHGEIMKDSKGEHVGFRNNMQFILALRNHDGPDDKSAVRTWLDKYSAQFGTAFDTVIDKDPRYFDGYATMGDIPEDKWQEIESLIYSQ